MIMQNKSSVKKHIYKNLHNYYIVENKDIVNSNHRQSFAEMIKSKNHFVLATVHFFRKVMIFSLLYPSPSSSKAES